MSGGWTPAQDDAILALEYAATIDADHRCGIWVKAFVEGQAWAVQDLKDWLARRGAATS